MPANETAIAQAGREGFFLFISGVLGVRVRGADEEAVGTLAELKVKLGELFPRVCAVGVKKRGERKLLEIDWRDVSAFGSAEIRLKPDARGAARVLEAGPDEILLRHELLDKQVVDTFGAKIERVNDIHLLLAHQELRVVHVDYGVRGILRRLGWLRATDRIFQWLFAAQLAEKMISWKYVQPLLSGTAKHDLKLNVTTRKIHEIHPSDLADILEELDRVNRASVFQTLDLQTAAQTLEEVEDPAVQASLLEGAPTEKVTDLLEEMAPDEATDLLADLPEERKEKIIRTMDAAPREAVVALLKFKEGTAGSIMTKDFLSLDEERTIGEAVEEFRKTSHPLECVSYIYVTGKDGHLAGVTTLRHLAISDRETQLKKLMNVHLITARPEDGVQDVTALFRKYKFLALPVVDENRVLQGIITLKDIMQAHFGA